VNTARKTNGRLVLIALVLIFAAPPLVSWLLFTYTDIGRGGGHGDLLQPSRPLPDAALVDGAGGTARLHGRWSLIYLAAGGCGNDCTAALYRMRQVRLATGRNSERLQRVIVFAGATPPLAEIAADWPGQLFADPAAGPGSFDAFRVAPDEDPLAAGRLYLVDPRGNLMMSYARDADPEGIIKDLRRLLRYSRSG
jgi:hypothetical protein